MIQVNTKDGKTLSFDITKKSKRDEFNNLVDDPEFSVKITGIGILYQGAHHVFPIPKDMNVKNYFAEPMIQQTKEKRTELTGEKIMCYVEGLRITLTVWYQKAGPRVATFEIRRLGKKVFDPNTMKAEEIKND